MKPLILLIIIVLSLLVVVGVPIVIMFKITIPIAKKVCRDTLVKTSPDKWGRVCSAPDNEEQVAMWRSGIKWAELHRVQPHVLVWGTSTKSRWIRLLSVSKLSTRLCGDTSSAKSGTRM